MVTNQDKQDRSKLPPHPDQQAPKKPKPPDDSSNPNLSFGEMDLGGGTDGEPIETDEVKKEAGQTKPPPAAPRQAAKPVSEPARPAPQEKARPRPAKPAFETPKKSHKKAFLVAFVVLILLCAIGAGVYFFLERQKQQELAKKQELDRLNQQSRDSLMDDRFKQGTKNP